ncbi:uncharacterized protein EV154DRAFT_478990 [Mucor mucedo]|uniref:uncharacterized protein n=1 Tax=Mucor mucedo TaxID=29922 RepID=UPI00221E9EF6|nr:uncharacterized protein EV154DRAFT_478990 [Mucor mucedo]KAI7893691.1 hypothetical protein EV154DRAFT_478990 [Mucor mucedo]
MPKWLVFQNSLHNRLPVTLELKLKNYHINISSIRAWNLESYAPSFDQGVISKSYDHMKLGIAGFFITASGRLLFQFANTATEVEIMGTIAATLCPSLKKRIISSCSEEKRGSNEWNAFRHAYKDKFKGDIHKAREAYLELSDDPDRRDKMCEIMERFEVYKLSQKRVKANTSADDDLKDLHKNHRIHVIMYGAFEDQTMKMGCFKFMNSGLARKYEVESTENDKTNTALKFQKFVLRNVSESRCVSKRPRQVVDHSEVQSEPSSSKRRLCNSTQMKLVLKKDIRGLLRESLRKATKLSKLETVPWDQVTTEQGFMNFKLAGWGYWK